jgi:hypothetical protein
MTQSHRLTRTAAGLAFLAALFALVAIGPAEAGSEAEYRVTITNITDGQPQTPWVVATHSGSVAAFEVGEPASPGLQSVAENGGVPDLVAELSGVVFDAAVAGGGPIAPGASASAYVTAGPGARKLTVVGMLICTNDGFAGLDSVTLNRSGSQMFYGFAYDAGTEINTQEYVDLVPPCDGLGQTGMTNPALAEGGVVHPHPGITDDGDLDPAVHGWDGPVIRVHVERVG